MKRILSSLIALLILLTCIPTSVYAINEEALLPDSNTDGSTDKTDEKTSSIEYVKYMSYLEYTNKYKDVSKGSSEIVINAGNLTDKSEGVEIRKDYNGFAGDALYTGDTDFVEFAFDAKEGLYNLYIEYFTEKGKDVTIERTLEINGAVPFDVAENLSFTRAWKDNLKEKDENGELTFDHDAFGNEIRPGQIEINKWKSSYFYDYLGYYASPLEFYFKDGVNTISLKSIKEPMTLGLIKLVPAEENVPYSEVKKQYQEKGYKDYSGEEVIIEAEFSTEKSDQTLYPISDVSTSSTSVKGGKNNAYTMSMNAIGSTNWQYPQQAISWTVDENVKPGLYAINFKARKNIYQGMLSSRKLLINGKIPFEEALTVEFNYNTDWYMVTPQTAEGEQCLIYLEPGYTITMESSLGRLSSLIRDADDVLTVINKIYRKILMITGSTPDKYRNYFFDELIENDIAEMGVQAEKLENIVKGIVSLTGKKGSDLSTLDTMALILRKMNQDDEIIAKQLKYFKTNIGALGTWLNTARNVPLELDYISLSSPGSEIKQPKVNFFSNLKFSINKFIASFIVDYNAIGSMVKKTNSEKTITVWLEKGRDQFQTLRSLINNQYTANTGNQVNLELVNAGALLPAVVAGIGPDVVLGQGQNEPVNFALRNSVLSLTANFDENEIAEVTKRFSPQALVPCYFYNGKSNDLYALPETQDFSVLFYRKDILSELGLEIPNTWDELINTIVVLNKNNMEFGMPANHNTFYALLLQNGGQMYADDLKSSALKENAATVAFRKWTNFYVNYGFPIEYDFQNRFRTGEMPLGVDNYALQNTLAVAAPEIRGLWGFTSIPGTYGEDGTLDRSNTLSTSHTFILKKANNPDLCWEFLKWWTSAETQAEYGKQLESILGPSARYNTANIDAFKSLPWSAQEISALDRQLNTCYSIPEIAGSYFIPRHITNAFRKVIYGNMDPKDTLYDYSNTIDSEITKKRTEFGLPTIDD